MQRKLWSEFDPMAVEPRLLPHLYVLEIQQPQADGDHYLRIRLTGTALDQFFARSLAGHYLEEFIHGPLGRDVISGFHGCATNRKALWMRQVVQVRNRAPRFVEGVAVYLDPARIYGALLTGDVADGKSVQQFERRDL